MGKYIHYFETEPEYNTARSENYEEPWVSLTETKQIPTQINNAYVGKEDSNNYYFLSGLINGELNWVITSNFDFNTTFPPEYTVVVNDNNTVTIQELNYTIQDIKITEIQQHDSIGIMTNKGILFSVESDTDIVYKTINLPQVNYNKKEYYVKFTWDGTSNWNDSFNNADDFVNEYLVTDTTDIPKHDFYIDNSDGYKTAYNNGDLFHKYLIQEYKLPNDITKPVNFYINNEFKGQIMLNNDNGIISGNLIGEFIFIVIHPSNNNLYYTYGLFNLPSPTA